MNETTKEKLNRLLADGLRVPALFYAVGFIWFVLLSQVEFNEPTNTSENALLVGQVEEKFDEDGALRQYQHKADDLYRSNDLNALRLWLSRELISIGLEVYTQNFTLSHEALYPLSEIHGSNLYAIMRSPSGGRTEALLLTVPLKADCSETHSCLSGSLSLILALMKTLRQQVYWAKDIIIVFPEFEYVGFLAWIEAYRGGTGLKNLRWTELEGRGGNIHAGLNLEFTRLDVLTIDVFPEGINGPLAESDLVNTVSKLIEKHWMRSVISGQDPDYPSHVSERLSWILGLVRAVWNQAPGSPTGLHGLLINHQIPAVTLRGPSLYSQHDQHGKEVTRVGRALEGILRSLNNLQEKLHAAAWYYLMPCAARFATLGLYIPPVLILIGSLLVKALSISFCSSTQDEDNNATSTDKENPSDITENKCADGAAGDQTKTTKKTEESDTDQSVRKRRNAESSSGEKKPPSLPVKSGETVQPSLPPILTHIAIWLTCSFAAGLCLNVAPMLIYSVANFDGFGAFRKLLGLDQMVDLFAVILVTLFFLLATLAPIIVSLLRRLLAEPVESKRNLSPSLLLILWTLYLSCTATLNVSTSILLSVPIVLVLILAINRCRSSEQKHRSMLSAACWLIVSPPGLLLLYCTLHALYFDESLLLSSTHSSEGKLTHNVWNWFTRSLLQSSIESDLFGCWTWSSMTLIFTPLWMLTWTYLCVE
ncbi:unnamed protein product [Calicophoron daubneyi]|uniref:Glycosylphosphatidylinositol anchor attachment 1 protein n=1 Tax=Calicophoron daubneyi TaxID=300641 RepID=A0AAV2TNQ0_CALDB